MMCWRAALIFMILFPTLSFGVEANKKNKAFFQGMIGSSGVIETENIPTGVPDDQETKAGTALTTALGYRWERFSLEFVFAHLGGPEINVADYYTEKHSAMFIGGGLHWTWNWFDLKVGWGNVKDKITYSQGPASTSFSADPNKKTHSSTAGYFGVGLNFNLGRDTELVFDYTGYGWTYEDTQILSVNGNPNTTFIGWDGGMAVLSLGLRWFL